MFYYTFIKFLKYFGKGHERKIILMAIYTFLTSLFDFFSVAIILPFLLMLIAPGDMTQNLFLRMAIKLFHLSTQLEVLKFSAISVIAMIVLKNIYAIFIMYWQNKHLKEWALDIKMKFMRMYLYSPFQMNSRYGDSERFFRISNTVDMVFDNFVFRVIVFTSNTIVIGLIFIWMIYLLPKYTILAALFFIISSSIQNRIIFSKAKLYADERYKMEQGPYNMLLACLKCLKEIKITSSENFFFGIYKRLATKLVPLNEKVNLLPMIPQYIIEIIFVFTIIILFVGIYNEFGMNRENILISLGVVSISLFRILPLMNKSQICINNIDVYKDYPQTVFQLYDSFKEYENYISEATEERMHFEKEIQIKNLQYAYDNTNWILKNLNFSIKKGEYVGIIGESGAGKTTLVDCLTGLLIGNGDIYIDGIKLQPENIKSYQNILGYVSQNTNTVSGNLVTNIAWGIPNSKIDRDKIEEALKQAKLYNQVMDLPNGLNTIINQDGTGLSQGQKQRIGIARAFYRKPELLIFDEATSSLDLKTESDIIDILADKKGQLTMVIVSHRMSTLRLCDKIIYMADGTIIDIDTFSNLTKKYSKFAEFVELSNVNAEK